MNYFWIDVESTGLDANRNDVIQLACIPVIDGVQLPQTFNEYCQPTNWNAIDAGATRVHGITEAKMRTFQPQEEMLNKFIAYAKQFNVKFAIAGFNVSFDRSFLSATFSKHGKSKEFLEIFSLDIHDTYKRAQEVKKLLKSTNLKLVSIADAYSIEIKAHDALSDIAATIKVDKIVADLLGELPDTALEEKPHVEVFREFAEPAQLHLHSMYNMINSIPSVQEWAKWCEKTGTPGFSIVDHGPATSCFDITRCNIKNVVGIPGVGFNFIFPSQKKEDFNTINAWAYTNEGYFNLLKLSSLGYRRTHTQAGTSLSIPVITTVEIKKYSNGIIFGIADINNCMGRAIINKDKAIAEERFNEYLKYFSKGSLAVEFNPIDIEYIHHPKMGFRRLHANVQKEYNKFLFEMCTKHDMLNKGLPTSGAHFIGAEDKIVQDCVSKMSSRGRYHHESYHAKTAKEIFVGLKHHLGDNLTEDLFEKWISNTHKIMNAAKSIKIEHEYHLPKFEMPDDILKETDDYSEQTRLLMMQKIKEHGRWRDDVIYVERFQRELDVVMKNPALNFIPYFLMYEDICSYARSQGFLQNIARGSAGGSLLSYYLKIIHVDPIIADLPFERFLSNARIRAGSFPDIDADFGDTARPVIIKYLKKKYDIGFAQISTFSKMKTKNAIKDAMWALYGRNRNDPEVDAVCKTIPDSPQGVDEKGFLYGYEDKEGTYYKGQIETNEMLINYFKAYPDVEKLTSKLIGTIRGWSRHASAFVISTVDLAATRVPTMVMGDKDIGSVNVTQFDASMVEKCGLVKADILGIKTLTAVTDCVKLVKERIGRDLLEEDKYGVQLLYRLPDDEGVYTDFYNKKTDSSFQFNTNVIKGSVQDFIPTERKHLSIMTALMRPGAMDAMMEYGVSKNATSTKKDEKHEKKVISAAKFYMKVRKGEVEPSFIHDDLKPALEDTYGVIVYQEQVMKILVDICGYSLEETDVIRSAIAKKKHDVMMAAFDRIRKATKQRGWSKAQSDSLCDTIMAFSRYSFNKSHSHAYAELGYITMYLKHHYPTEWWTSVLNLHLDDEDKMRKDIMLLGDKVAPPSLKNPTRRFAITEDNRIMAPISAIKGTGPKAVQELTEKGPFMDLWDFITRVNHIRVNIGTFGVLIKARAADDFMDKDIPYPEARLKFLKDYTILRKKKLKTFASHFRPELFEVDPLSIFLMERDYNTCFNKTLLTDQKLRKIVTDNWPGLVRRDVHDIPFTMGQTPVLSGVDTAGRLLSKGFNKDVGLILLFKSSSSKSGISKKTGKPYSFTKIMLSDGYNDIECMRWDLNKPLHWKIDSIVYVRGTLKEGWRTPVSMTLRELDKIEKVTL